MANDVSVKPSEVNVVGETTHITSPDLIDALIQDKEATIEGLSKLVAPFDEKEMHVDKFGRLVVRNPRFAAALSARLKSSVNILDNTVCNGGACVSPSGITAKSTPQ